MVIRFSLYDQRLRNGRFSLLLTLMAGSFALVGKTFRVEAERPREDVLACACPRGCDRSGPGLSVLTTICGFATVGRLPVKGLISSLSMLASGAV